LAHVPDFKDILRIVIAQQSWAELFFLDGATVLAAGQRIGLLCWRRGAGALHAAWEKSN
jgi:hypothetical protein